MNRRNMSDEQTYQIQRLSSALEVSSNTIKSLEEKLSRLQHLVALMEQDKKNWEQQKITQDIIMKQQLLNSDAEKRVLQEEIISLRSRLKAAA